MSIFADILKISFFEGNKMITKRKDYEFSKLSNDSSLYLDLTDPKYRAILDLIMKSEFIQLDGITYKVLDKEFFVDGTALYLSLEKVN